MKLVRILVLGVLAFSLAFAVSACSKKSETEIGMNADSTMTQAPSDQTAPPEPSTSAQGATLPPENAPSKSSATKTTHKSTHTSGGTAVNAGAHTIDIPTGTTFDIAMKTPVDTRTSNVGDALEGELVEPITSAGVVLADKGAHIRGEISDLKRASRSKSADERASVAMTFTSIETVDGVKTLHATVANSEGKLVAKSTSTRDKLLIGGSTVAGAVAGKIIGKDTKSTIIGAVGGAVVGTGVVLASKGHELVIDEGAKVSLRVDQPIAVAQK